MEARTHILGRRISSKKANDRTEYFRFSGGTTFLLVGRERSTCAQREFRRAEGTAR